ncbi:MAG: hypothetical protein EKK46_05820 [Rhodocyclaceae bacterium]|nr:MAG: hypothetical protein EKK46_05820 [Rhodocyclaceae bacterium]
MKKTLLSVAIASVLAAPALSAFAEDAPPPSPLTFNVGVVSDYLFRGVSQTHGDAAIQGGIDYAFSNGFYVGTWASSISWVKDWLGKGSMEWDLYGGYKGTINPDWSYDVGVISYIYPNHGDYISGGLANPNTTELRGAVTWKWLTARYSYAVSPYFIGWYGGTAFDQKTRGSDYVELNAAYDLGDGWGVSGHVGHQNVEKSVPVGALKSASYSDWNIGVTKDVGFGVVGLTYSATNVDSGSCNSTGGSTTNPYCWGTNGSGSNQTIPTSGFKNVARDTFYLSFLKTF